MIEFEVGEIIHILNEEPSEEMVRATGCEPSSWIEEMNPYIGKEGVVTRVHDNWRRHGKRYEVEFADVRSNPDMALYGIDFREFYEEQKSVLTPEALITLLG